MENNETMQNNDTTVNTPKKNWSWRGFFFAPYYYSGYGDLKKGLIMGAVGALLPILMIGVGIYAGSRAKNELPIGEVAFNWKYVGITVLLVVVESFIVMSVTGQL